MTKRLELVDTTISAPKKRSSIDWSLCMLCQEETGLPMQYPTRSTREPCGGSGYKSLAHYLMKLEVADTMDPRICASLPAFHAFTGCDTVSSFGGKGKRSAWNSYVGSLSRGHSSF